MDAPASRQFYLDTNRNKTRDQMVFKFKMKRKSLFYIFNLIIPTFLISSLTICVFYLPAGDEKKITLSLSLLFALVVFFLLISKIIPPTSIVVPLISKYFLLTFILNILSILSTSIVIKVYHTETKEIHPWLHFIFVKFLATLLFMKNNTPDFVLINSQNNDIENKKENTCLDSPIIRINSLNKINYIKNKKSNLYQNFNYESKNICDLNKY